MEKINEQYGEGNAYDFGARLLDPRLGKWLSIDPLFMKYPDLSPYNFVANTPLSAIDPDGKLIIFINGYWGNPTQACCGGSIDHWGADWVKNVQKRVGDKNALFLDGSLGGPNGLVRGSLNPLIRRAAGYMDGKRMAADIINSLQRNEDGEITESIKFVNSSMGSAYQRGFIKALKKYADKIILKLLLNLLLI